MSNYSFSSIRSTRSSTHHTGASNEITHQYVYSPYQTSSVSKTITTEPVSTVKTQSNDPVKIVCISDSHNRHGQQKFRDKINQLPGDILIHAGHFSESGSLKDPKSTLLWFRSLDKFKHKIFNADNMDGICFEDQQGNEIFT